MRHHWREYLNKNLAGLTEGVTDIVAVDRGVESCDQRGQLIGEIVDLGDAAIEAQTAEIVFSLDQNGVRGLADSVRFFAVFRNLVRLRRDIRDFGDQAP